MFRRNYNSYSGTNKGSTSKGNERSKELGSIQTLFFLPYAGYRFSEYYLIVKKGDDDMIFGKGSVPVKVAAKVYGKNPEWIRLGIVSGYLPIGIATRDGRQITDVAELNCKYGRTNFYISPKKLYEETGYLWEGEK